MLKTDSNKGLSWSEEYTNCPLCGGNKSKRLGIRGNKEYFGAVLKLGEPHIVTNIERCVACDFIYINPMLYGLELGEKELYNSPLKYQATQCNIVSMFQKRLSFIANYKKYGRLLDIGAGNGEFLYEARNNGWEAVGIEPSPEFCRFAKEHYNVKIQEGFLGQALNIKKSYFDMITLNHVLEHVEKPYELLKLIKEYLVNDGLLFIEVPNADSYLLRIIDIYFRLKGLRWSSRLSPMHPPYHKYGFTIKSILYLLKKADYQLVDIKTFPGSERGHQKEYNGLKIVTILQHFVIRGVSFMGNRELICVIAKPI